MLLNKYYKFKFCNFFQFIYLTFNVSYVRIICLFQHFSSSCISIIYGRIYNCEFVLYLFLVNVVGNVVYGTGGK